MSSHLLSELGSKSSGISSSRALHLLFPAKRHPSASLALKTQEDGVCEFWAVIPVAYPIPSDGPVGSLLRSLHTSWPSTLPMFLSAGDDPIVGLRPGIPCNAELFQTRTRLDTFP
ncbi:hypothetical protein DACRYDRAFT_105021 [Dacryopinax primogenitus]|uniref:Uncharacterized protein n=1 Tax=Dacryopinax primogenitus (strain DJM 731) TaxID=1858805 RepID=M5GGA3_DACPD|nr:uncharacterized protein DACRYDRAFT_105021 [Dacryopinax primogenitus]EJU05138.1 hypothetical protein DACRYDRAFT_105021 [Dacryopinax primogenitus]